MSDRLSSLKMDPGRGLASHTSQMELQQLRDVVTCKVGAVTGLRATPLQYVTCPGIDMVLWCTDLPGAQDRHYHHQVLPRVLPGVCRGQHQGTQQELPWVPEKVRPRRHQEALPGLSPDAQQALLPVLQGA